jgi:DNA-binding YbaB/EbfC family protein
MGKMDQAKALMQAKKLQGELKKLIIVGEAGDGAVKVEVTGEQKVKKININPEYVDLDDIGQLEKWIEDAIKAAMQESQKIAAEKVQPLLGSLGNLGF